MYRNLIFRTVIQSERTSNELLIASNACHQFCIWAPYNYFDWIQITKSYYHDRCTIIIQVNANDFLIISGYTHFIKKLNDFQKNGVHEILTQFKEL